MLLLSITLHLPISKWTFFNLVDYVAITWCGQIVVTFKWKSISNLVFFLVVMFSNLFPFQIRTKLKICSILSTIFVVNFCLFKEMCKLGVFCNHHSQSFQFSCFAFSLKALTSIYIVANFWTQITSSQFMWNEKF